MSLIFVAVSVVFAVVCARLFFSYDLGLHTNHDLLYTRSFSFSLVQLYIICYQPELWIYIRESAKGFLDLADMYRIIPSFRMCTSNTILCMQDTILCGTWSAIWK